MKLTELVIISLCVYDSWFHSSMHIDSSHFLWLFSAVHSWIGYSIAIIWTRAHFFILKFTCCSTIPSDDGDWIWQISLFYNYHLEKIQLNILCFSIAFFSLLFPNCCKVWNLDESNIIFGSSWKSINVVVFPFCCIGMLRVLF